MTLSFNAICAIVVVVSLITSVLLAPILWDAAGYVEHILNKIYNPMENLR